MGSLESMTGWVFPWFTTVRARLSRRGDLMLEHIVLRHQLAILQRTGSIVRVCKNCFTSNYFGCGKTRSNSAIEISNALASRSRHR